MPRNSFHVAASPFCAQKIAVKKRIKAEALAKTRERIKDRALREKMKRPSEIDAEAQKAVNDWVRKVRDKDEPCISCNRSDLSDPLTGGAWDCGHYRSRGAAKNLRFILDNMAKQCKRCNRRLAGNHVEFRKGLVARIGEERVVAVECDNTPRRYRADDFRRIRDEYRALTRLALKALND